MNACTISRSGIGLPQFSGTLRRRYLAKTGAAWCSPKLQIEFVVEVLGEMGIKDKLFGERDPGIAATLFMHRFDRPRDRSPHRRVARARAIYQALSAGAIP